MQLTPLQLEIQRWSDQSLNFGCIVSINDTFGPAFGYYLGIKVYRPDLEKSTTEKISELDIIGHPMDYGRLKYIYFDCEPYTNMCEHFQKLEKMFLKSIERYNQTVLEWDEETQIAVRDFLLSLPPKND